jgi:macrodomain Ter protein organizer (MatP/YcbG family)
MARTPGVLKPEAVAPVLAYLKMASLRGADIFRAGTSGAKRLAVLERELRSVKAELRHQALGQWIVRHLSPEGRTKMLATLRRRRADAKAANKGMTLRISAKDGRELQALAKQLGMPAALALRTLVLIAAADKGLRAQVVRLVKATSSGKERQ